MRALHLLDEPYDSGITAYGLAAAAGLRGRGQEHCVAALEGKPPFLEARRLGLETFPLRRAVWLDLLRLRRFIVDRRMEILVAHTGRGHSLCVAAATGLPTRVVRVRAASRPIRKCPSARLLWSRTAGFIAANRAIQEQARPLLAGRPAAVVHQGLADPGPATALPNDAPVVGMLGRLDPVKGHEIFLEAAARLCERIPSVSFRIAGRDENVKASELLAKARGLGLEGRVSLLGHVGDAPGFMRGCHAGVVCSLGSEAVSRAAVEWLACGRPLAASAVGCLPEYLEDCPGAVVVSPGSAQELADALFGFLRERAALESAAQAARRCYEERFTLARFLDGFDALLRLAAQ